MIRVILNRLFFRPESFVWMPALSAPTGSSLSTLMAFA